MVKEKASTDGRTEADINTETKDAVDILITVFLWRFLDFNLV